MRDAGAGCRQAGRIGQVGLLVLGVAAGCAGPATPPVGAGSAATTQPVVAQPLVTQPGTAQQAPPQRNAMTVDQFLAARAGLIGRSVNVEGLVQCVNRTACGLYRDQNTTDMQAWFDIEHLPLDIRSRLLGCAIITAPCDVVVTGQVVLSATNHLIARSVAWQPDSQ